MAKQTHESSDASALCEKFGVKINPIFYIQFNSSKDLTRLRHLGGWNTVNDYLLLLYLIACLFYHTNFAEAIAVL
jgi:hypothetical protein